MRTRVVFSGYFGCGNAGDEAVLAAELQALRQVRPEARPIVLSADSPATARLHGCPARPRMSPPALLGAIARTDVLVSGGGSLLQDVTSARSALYYLFVMRLAHWMRRPVMAYAQGIGPLHSPGIRRLTARVLSRAAAVTVRDPASADLLAELGVLRSRVEVTADPVFGLYDPSAEWCREGPVGVALRPWGDEDIVPRAVELLKLLARAGVARTVLLPMHEPGDRELAERIRNEAPEAELAPAGLPTPDLLDRVSGMSLMIGMRLHALVFAAVRGVPCVALDYDPKVTALMDLLGVPESRLPLSASPSAVRDAALVALSRGAVTPRETLETLRRRALRNAEVLAEVLDGRR